MRNVGYKVWSCFKSWSNLALGEAVRGGGQSAEVILATTCCQSVGETGPNLVERAIATPNTKSL